MEQIGGGRLGRGRGGGAYVVDFYQKQSTLEAESSMGQTGCGMLGRGWARDGVGELTWLLSVKSNQH